VFVGRLVPYKGADMLLEAAAELIRSGAVTVEIIGDGPQRAALEELVHERGLNTGVRMTGFVKHSELQLKLAESDVFAFPSIREFGGAVVLEAMAMGTVPIVMRYGGPGELATDETGFLIEMGTRKQIIERFGSILRELVRRPEQVDQRSPLAARRARELFTWEAKAKQVMRVYEWVLGRGMKPQYSIPLTDLGEEWPVNNDWSACSNRAAISASTTSI
jgi:glycosyltransferase involved in cell wall biosynthesis